MLRPTLLALAIGAGALLTGCDMVTDTLGIVSSEKVAAARDADGKAIGGACRNAGRAIEDCFALNKKADKAAMLAGWRDMNDYMHDNKVDPVLPRLPSPDGGAATKDAAAAGDVKPDDAAPDDATPEKPTKKAAASTKAHPREAAKAHDS